MFKLSCQKNRGLCEFLGMKLWKIGKDDILNFTLSIFNVYQNVYKEKYNSEMKELDKVEMVEEDLFYFNSTASAFLVVTDQDSRILGTSRVLKKKQNIKLPTEKIYNINAVDMFFAGDAEKASNNLYHSGRLTIDKQALAESGIDRKYSSLIFLKLAEFVTSVMTDNDKIIIGEYDYLAFRASKKLGIYAKEISEPINYLGSVTYPLYSNKKFLKIHSADVNIFN